MVSCTTIYFFHFTFFVFMMTGEAVPSLKLAHHCFYFPRLLARPQTEHRAFPRISPWKHLLRL